MNERTPGLKEFDSQNKDHVIWLRDFTDCIQRLGGDQTEGIAAGLTMRRLLSGNPMKVNVTPEAFIDMHVGMSVKYAGNVLEGTAWIPPPKESHYDINETVPAGSGEDAAMFNNM